MTKLQRNITIVILAIAAFVGLGILINKISLKSNYFPENNIGILERRDGKEFAVIKNYNVGIQDKICASQTVERLKEYTFDKSSYIAAKYNGFNQTIFRGLSSAESCTVVITTYYQYYVNDNQTSPNNDIMCLVYHYNKSTGSYNFLGMEPRSYIDSKFEKYDDTLYAYACYCELKYN